MPDDTNRQFDALLRGLTELRDNPPPEPPSENFIRTLQEVLDAQDERRYQQLMTRLGWAEGDDSQ